MVDGGAVVVVVEVDNVVVAVVCPKPRRVRVMGVRMVDRYIFSFFLGSVGSRRVDDVDRVRDLSGFVVVMVKIVRVG